MMIFSAKMKKGTFRRKPLVFTAYYLTAWL